MLCPLAICYICSNKDVTFINGQADTNQIKMNGPRDKVSLNLNARAGVTDYLALCMSSAVPVAAHIVS